MCIEHISKHHVLLKPRRIIFPEERLQHIFPVAFLQDNRNNRRTAILVLQIHNSDNLIG